MKARVPRPIVAFTLPIVCSLVIAPGAAHAAWSGWMRCTLENAAQGYINTETHTWFVNGASPTVEGTGSWSVAGQGHYDRTDQVTSQHQEWSVSAQMATGRFAVVISSGMLSIQARHGQSTQSNGYSGYGQQTVNGSPRAPVDLMATAYEWPFPRVEGPATSTTLSDSRSRTLMQPWSPFGGGHNTTLETCSWMLADGSIPPLPPPVTPPASGLTRVNTVVSSPQVSWPTATIQLGKSDLVGGGAQTNWTGNGNLLTATHPGPLGQNRWVAAGKDHWYLDPTTITAYAIALVDPSDQWEVDVVAETSTLSSAPVARAILTSGYALTGGGCLLNRPQGAPGHLLTASFPASPTTWECRSKDHTIPSPTTPSGRVNSPPERGSGAASLDRNSLDRGSKETITSYVIGVKPKPGSGLAQPMVQITSETTSTPTNHPEASVAGLPNWTVTGGGAEALLTDPNGAGQFLTATVPTVAAGSNIPTGWYAKSKDHGIASPGTVKVYVISVKFY